MLCPAPNILFNQEIHHIQEVRFFQNWHFTGKLNDTKHFYPTFTLQVTMKSLQVHLFPTELSSDGRYEVNVNSTSFFTKNNVFFHLSTANLRALFSQWCVFSFMSNSYTCWWFQSGQEIDSRHLRLPSSLQISTSQRQFGDRFHLWNCK